MGMARREGKVVFLPGVLPGEAVEAEVTHVRRDYALARVARMLEPSPDRIDPPCPHYGECGGCQLQHAVYARQLREKEAILRETFLRTARLPDPPLLPIRPAPEPFGYRIRTQLKVRDRVLGYYATGTHRLVPVAACPLLHPLLNQALARLGGFLQGTPLPALSAIHLATDVPPKGIWMTLYGRDQAPLSPDLPVDLSDRLRREIPSLRGLLLASAASGGSGRPGLPPRLLWGTETLTLEAHPLTFQVTAGTFTQVHGAMNLLILETLRQWVGRAEGKMLLDLYAGYGNLSLPLAGQVQLILAVESDPQAASDAIASARLNGITRFRALAAPAEEGLKQLRREGIRPGIVLLDPPRQGCSREALEGILDLETPRLLYLSCDPATLARDARRFLAAGYRVRRIQPFDLFPQTAHLETLVELLPHETHIEKTS
jgi:tRNA/tmRNA/rRNA uracil-C5-methylase (TrmA/RlmC/RlmD family)